MPVVDEQHFVGMVSLRDLLRERDDAPVGSVADHDVEALSPTDDQEVAARRILDREDLALPVIDADGAVIGVVTIDDAMEILQLEEAEDAARSSGTSPLRQLHLAASLLRLARSRVTWLVAAAVAGVQPARSAGRGSDLARLRAETRTRRVPDARRRHRPARLLPLCPHRVRTLTRAHAPDEPPVSGLAPDRRRAVAAAPSNESF